MSLVSMASRRAISSLSRNGLTIVIVSSAAPDEIDPFIRMTGTDVSYREAWELVIKNYPDTTAANLAKQRLPQLGPPKP